MTKRVIPSVFATSYADFLKRFELITGIAKYIHIDIMDGEFVKAKSMPPEEIPELTEYHSLFEAHLMVNEPRDLFPLLKEKGFKRVIFHIEAHKDRDDLLKSIQLAKSMELSPMVAINPDTSVEDLYPFTQVIDGVLFMGVMPGAEKQPFIPSDYERISQLHKFDEALWLQVDGGIVPAVASHLAKIGVSGVNSGSYVSGSKDPKHALEQLEQAIGGNY